MNDVYSDVLDVPGRLRDGFGQSPSQGAHCRSRQEGKPGSETISAAEV